VLGGGSCNGEKQSKTINFDSFNNQNSTTWPNSGMSNKVWGRKPKTKKVSVIPLSTQLPRCDDLIVL
jgi:hypothetical protein